MRLLTLLAAGLCLAASPVLAQTAAKALTPEQVEARAAARKAQQDAVDEWGLFAAQRAAASKCPSARPDRVRVLTTGMEMRQQGLRDAGQRPDWDGQNAKLKAQVDALPCNSPILKGYTDSIEDSYAIILLQAAGWYALRETPCGALKVQPADVRVLVEAIAAKNKMAGGLWTAWKTTSQSERDRQCIRDSIVSNDVQAMLADLNRWTKDKPTDWIRLEYPLGAFVTDITARRSQDGAKVLPTMLPVEVNVTDPDNVPALVAYTLDNKLIARLDPRKAGQDGQGVELQFFEGRTSEKPYKVIKPARELARIPYFRAGAGVADTRTWEFGPDAEAEITKAAPGAWILLGVTATGGKPYDPPPWVSAEEARAHLRFNVVDLRAARSWAFTPGTLGTPFKK